MPTDRFAWIDASPPPAQQEVLRQAFARLGLPPTGDGLDHVLRIHGPMPRTLEQHLAFYRGILREPGPLPRAVREIIGVVVSKRNGCHY